MAAYRFHVFVILTLLALTGCRREATVDQSPQPILVASQTPLPRSTALPPLPTRVAMGSSENPIQLLLPSAWVESDPTSSIRVIETALGSQLGWAVQIQLVQRQSDAIAALCNSITGKIAIAWLDGIAFAIAQDRACGDPILQAVNRNGTDSQADAAVTLVVQADSIRDFNGLRGATFCRISNDDPISWTVPALLMKANGIDPATELGSLRDLDTPSDLLMAVAEGDCDAAGVSANTLAEFTQESPEEAAQITVLSTSTPFPSRVLVVPPGLTLGMRQTLTEILLTMSESTDVSAPLQSVLGVDTLIRVTNADFVDWRSFLVGTGFNQFQLGN